MWNKIAPAIPDREYFDSMSHGCCASAAVAAYWTDGARLRYARMSNCEMRGAPMGILREIFSWWDGNTLGTRITIARQGRFVGKDEFGNRYYEQKKGVGPLGRPRRWVTYTDFAEASKVGADWHGWLHHTFDEPPTKQNYQPRPWQRPHLMNMTGTAEAYRPPGSILARGVRPKATGDYKPWRPQS
jgi:NADH:ubiquinone oxidoreductase subunit